MVQSDPAKDSCSGWSSHVDLVLRWAVEIKGQIRGVFSTWNGQVLMGWVRTEEELKMVAKCPPCRSGSWVPSLRWELRAKRRHIPWRQAPGFLF